MDDDIINLYKMSEYTPPAHVTAYHVTRKSCLKSIKRSGLTAQPCKATTYGDSRVSAVYLFAYRQDAYDDDLRAYLFGDEGNLEVVTVTIPRSHFDKMHYDGLFNMSAICKDGSYPTAIQYRDHIPASWIK